MEMSYPPKILHVGDFALFPKTVSASDVTLFAGVSGDMNPLYLNETYGQHSSYKMRLVPPMLIASMMGGAVNRLLRPSSCPVERRFSVRKPMQVGDTITVVGEVTRKVLEKKYVYVRTTVYNQNDEMVADGYVRELMQVH